MAGASTSASGRRPNRACSASQPSTQPGIVTVRMSPRYGIRRWPAARSAVASAPEPAAPTATSAAGSPAPGPGWSTATRSPPIPHICWVVTASTAEAATAASTALPPDRSRLSPAALAKWSTEQTRPRGA